MARPSNRERRRQEIVLGLASVMARRGYDGASVLEIAHEARLAPGLLHYHFASKGEILLALIDHLRRVVDGRFTRRLSATAASPRAELRAYIDARVGLGKDADPAAMACWVAIAAEALRKPDVRKVFGRAVDEERALLERILRKVLACERRSVARVRELAAAILSAIQGAYQMGLSAPEVIPRGTASKLIRTMADGLIAAQPRRR